MKKKAGSDWGKFLLYKALLGGGRKKKGGGKKEGKKREQEIPFQRGKSDGLDRAADGGGVLELGRKD